MPKKYEIADNQISLLEGYSDLPEQRVAVATSIDERNKSNLDHLLEGEKPIFYTDKGEPVFSADNPEEFYSRPIEDRSVNPMFIKEQENNFRAEMGPLFKQICEDVSAMQTNKDSREIFYIPKDTRLFVEPKKTGTLYPADSKDRLFVVINGTAVLDIKNKGKGKEIRTAYELLPSNSRRISLKSRENDLGESITKPGKIAKDCRLVIPSTYLEGERYFNLSKAGVLGNFDQFCDCVKRCDEKAQKSKLLR